MRERPHAQPLAGTIVRVDGSLTGMPPNGHSLHAGMSGDGRYVAFLINASNFFPSDLNGLQEIVDARVP